MNGVRRNSPFCAILKKKNDWEKNEGSDSLVIESLTKILYTKVIPYTPSPFGWGQPLTMVERLRSPLSH